MTTRQRLRELLARRPPMSPTALSDALRDYGVEIGPQAVVEEVKAVANSEEVLVAPPRCRECGFDRFHTPANIPSRCPECRSSWIAEPEFTIESKAG